MTDLRVSDQGTVDEIPPRPRWPVTMRADGSAAFHLHTGGKRADTSLEWGEMVFSGAGTLTVGL